MSRTLDAVLDDQPAPTAAPTRWQPRKTGRGLPNVEAMQVPVGEAPEAAAAWPVLDEWLTAGEWPHEIIEPDDGMPRSILVGSERAWPGDWIVRTDAGFQRFKAGVFPDLFEPEALTATGEPAERPAGAHVGGRWILHDSDLPFTAIGGRCMVTGVSPKPGQRFFEIGVEVRDDTPNGDVCLSEGYIVEMATAVGMVSADRHAAALAEIDNLTARLAEQEAKYQALKDTTPAQLDTAKAIADLERQVAWIAGHLASEASQKASTTRKSTSKQQQPTTPVPDQEK